MTELADAAFRQASRKLVERAKANGTPLIVWEDGQIKEVYPGRKRARRQGRDR